MKQRGVSSQVLREFVSLVVKSFYMPRTGHRRVQMRMGELRERLNNHLLTEMTIPGLIPWPEESKTIPEITEDDLTNKVGPFEQRLASILGGEVVGGSESRDIVVGNVSYEVKKPDKSNEVRLGGEGMLAFGDARGQIEAVCKQLVSVFQTGQEDVQGSMDPADYAKVTDFVQKDVPEIMKGNLSAGRMKEMEQVLHIVSSVVNSDKSEIDADELFLMMGDDERSVERDIDIKTYLRVGNLLQVPNTEMGITGSDVAFATLDHEAFHDPGAFMAKNWKNAVKASSTLSQVDNVVFVSSSGYRIVPKSEIDDIMVFHRVAAGRLLFRVIA